MTEATIQDVFRVVNETRAELRAEMRAMRSEVSSLSEDIGSIRRSIGAIHGELGNIHQGIANLITDYDTSRERHKATDVRITRIEARLEALEEKLP